MSTGNEDSFIEDLHNATVWLSYYDTITEGIWIVSMSELARFSFSKMLNLLDELFEEKA